MYVIREAADKERIDANNLTQNRITFKIERKKLCVQ